MKILKMIEELPKMTILLHVFAAMLAVNLFSILANHSTSYLSICPRDRADT